jgi:molybdopterin converting factor small subunit
MVFVGIFSIAARYYMKVTVLFFGATADAAGKRRLDITVAEDTLAQAVFDRVVEELPGLQGHKLLFSLNQEYASGETLVRDGDELAVFTAVSGG